MWEKYRSGTGFSEPFVIHYQDYSKGMYQRLCGRSTGLVPASQSPSSYTTQTTVKVCIRDCVGEIQEWYRLLRALRHTLPGLQKRYVSEIVWEKYRFGTGFSEPFVIHFPDYSKGTVKSVIVVTSIKQAIHISYCSLMFNPFS